MKQIIELKGVTFTEEKGWAYTVKFHMPRASLWDRLNGHELPIEGTFTFVHSYGSYFEDEAGQDVNYKTCKFLSAFEQILREHYPEYVMGEMKLPERSLWIERAKFSERVIDYGVPINSSQPWRGVYAYEQFDTWPNF